MINDIFGTQAVKPKALTHSASLPHRGLSAKPGWVCKPHSPPSPCSPAPPFLTHFEPTNWRPEKFWSRQKPRKHIPFRSRPAWPAHVVWTAPSPYLQLLQKPGPNCRAHALCAHSWESKQTQNMSKAIPGTERRLLPIIKQNFSSYIRVGGERLRALPKEVGSLPTELPGSQTANLLLWRAGACAVTPPRCSSTRQERAS